MSLTSFLANNKDVRERFRQEFRKPNFSIKMDIVAPPLSNRYILVGTAFDYLLRFYLQSLNPTAMSKGYWIAEAALARIDPFAESPLLLKGQNIVSQTRERLQDFLKSGNMSDKLIESALLLATLDPIFRSGTGHESVGIVYTEDVQDLRNLISIVDPAMFSANNLCLLNPTFGVASQMVGGADADVVIDNTIIDIKTTKKLELRGESFHQLMGYYALHEIAGIGEINPKLDIKRVAIYFSRYAYLYLLDLKDIINQQTFPDFIKWFKERASKAYGSIKP
jgi:hypothetical protein